MKILALFMVECQACELKALADKACVSYQMPPLHNPFFRVFSFLAKLTVLQIFSYLDFSGIPDSDQEVAVAFYSIKVFFLLYILRMDESSCLHSSLNKFLHC
jgi:hypothetical protein